MSRPRPWLWMALWLTILLGGYVVYRDATNGHHAPNATHCTPSSTPSTLRTCP